jgi:hypothetical protein
MTQTQTRSPYGDNKRRNDNSRGISQLERDHSMNTAELGAALALPEQRPGTGIHTMAPPQSMIEYPTSSINNSNSSMLTTSDTFLNASRAMMTSQGSLLDDVDQDVGMTTMNPSTSPNPNHAAHIGNDDRRLPPTPTLLPPSPTRTNSTASIPVYPQPAINTNTNTNTNTKANATNTALGTRSNHSTPSLKDPVYASNNIDSQSRSQSHHRHDDDESGSYSDDSAVQQARQHMEEIRQLRRPIRLPVPEEMVPPLLPPLPRSGSGSANNRRILLLEEPSIPVPRSSRRVRVGPNAVRRPPDLVRGTVYRFDNNDGNDDGNGDDTNDQTPMRRLRPEEMLVRCESCQCYLQLCKSAIVVQCPACGAISPAKSTS